jgi:hypothetical protein
MKIITTFSIGELQFSSMAVATEVAKSIGIGLEQIIPKEDLIYQSLKEYLDDRERLKKAKEYQEALSRIDPKDREILGLPTMFEANEKLLEKMKDHLSVRSFNSLVGSLGLSYESTLKQAFGAIEAFGGLKVMVQSPTIRFFGKKSATELQFLAEECGITLEY